MAIVVGFSAAVMCLVILYNLALGLFTGAAVIVPLVMATFVGCAVSSVIDRRWMRNGIWMVVLMFILSVTYVTFLTYCLAGSRSGQGVPIR
jgi:hypothetical protein